ncbi:HAMP domain-containing sensor histidine kinase [Lachnospiraceae bacterium 62-35]
MRHSIRTRLVIVFGGLMVLILLAIWGVNNWLLEAFYINDKLKNLKMAYTKIDNVLGELWMSELEPYTENEDADGLSVILREFGEKYNVTVVLVDSLSGNVIISSARDKEYLVEKIKRYIMDDYGNFPIEILLKEDTYEMRRYYNPRTDTSYLESVGYFSDNKTLFIMSTPLASIWDSVRLSNRFLGTVGLIAIVISAGIIYLITQRITSPIMGLAKLSVQMSNLDFEAKYTGREEDEIGILGHSMNRLSEKLKETIGELKSANNELQKDIKKKIQIDEMRKEFISNVSHELKTPIALIQGYAEGLSEGMCEEKESRDYYCGVIVDEANKMNKMVRQLLDLTALEFGDNTPVMECFDIIALINGILASADILIQQKEVEVEFAADGPVFVWADEFKIEEVVTNYLSNALNHLEPIFTGKDTRDFAETEGKKKIRITVKRQEDDVKVSIYNTGNPIPEEDIPKLWTKFYKVDKARTREYGGSGIGLSIVKAIMDSHNKEYGVRNIEDGVEFWFTLDGNMEE